MYDLIIIGAGPGGYPAAVFAAKSGLKVCVIEKENIGGVCLNYGCIPTKSLLKASEYITNIKHADDWGIIASYKIDIKKMVAQSRATVEKLTSGINYLFKTNKIDLIKATGSIKKIEDNLITVQLDHGIKEISGKNLIIATGSTARSLPNAPKSKLIWGAKEAMLPEKIPGKIGIIGAGAIGVEFAHFYSTIGSDVTIFETAPNILPGMDQELAITMAKILEKNGIKINTNCKIDKIEEKNEKIKIEYSNKIEEFDNIIVAIGVVPNTFSQFTLEKNYFKTNNLHQIYINEKNVQNVYAIGDCTSGPWLAHKATYEGIRAVRNILGQKLEATQPVALCIYTTPQIASIGATCEQLKEKYQNEYTKKVKILRSTFMANGKAIAIKEPDGFIKILCDNDTGEILGAHMIGPEVTELIHSIALGMKLEALPEDFTQTIFPHPTLSETIYEAFLESH